MFAFKGLNVSGSVGQTSFNSNAMDVRRAEGFSVQISNAPSGPGTQYPAGTGSVQVSNTPFNLENDGLDIPRGELTGSTLNWSTLTNVFINSGSAGQLIRFETTGASGITATNVTQSLGTPIFLNYPTEYCDFVRFKWAADPGLTSGTINVHIRAKGPR